VRWGWYHRSPKTGQECKRYVTDRADARREGYHLKLRARRNDGYLNAWNLEPPVSRSGGKSWKDYTTKRAQWDG
jgi:hypothetical protein